MSVKMKKTHAKAGMLNKKAASPRSRPDEILKTLALKPGQRVADIGAGGGYFTLRFAEEVGSQGTVYAIDTNPDFLKMISASARARGLGNVKTVIAAGKLALPKGSLDLIFMRNLHHHLEDRVAYFKTLKAFIKPKGRLVIIEHKPGAGSIFSFRRLFGHSTPKETIISEVSAAGYNLAQGYDILPEQNFLIFSPR